MEPIEDFFAKNRQQVQQDLEDATAIVHFLLERGFDHRRRNHLGECAADIAEKNYMPEVAQLIRDTG
ncbi:hypothetical protein [Flavilitoribacter nigricans]|nr:hypothetical protein [Flavilitoribacter nigricans]